LKHGCADHSGSSVECVCTMVMHSSSNKQPRQKASGVGRSANKESSGSSGRSVGKMGSGASLACRYILMPMLVAAIAMIAGAIYLQPAPLPALPKQRGRHRMGQFSRPSPPSGPSQPYGPPQPKQNPKPATHRDPPYMPHRTDTARTPPSGAGPPMGPARWPASPESIAMLEREEAAAAAKEEAARRMAAEREASLRATAVRAAAEREAAERAAADREHAASMSDDFDDGDPPVAKPAAQAPPADAGTSSGDAKILSSVLRGLPPNCAIKSSAEDAFLHANDLKKQQNLVDALACYKVALDLEDDPTSGRTASVYNNLANTIKRTEPTQLDCGERPCDLDMLADAAAHSLRTVLTLNPRHANAYVNLASILRSRDQLEEAAGLYRSAVAVEPRHQKAYNELNAVEVQLSQR